MVRQGILKVDSNSGNSPEEKAKYLRKQVDDMIYEFVSTQLKNNGISLDSNVNTSEIKSISNITYNSLIQLEKNNINYKDGFKNLVTSSNLPSGIKDSLK